MKGNVSSALLRKKSWPFMIDLKPYGAFVEYTIRPLIEELKQVKVIRDVDINQAIKEVLKIHVFSVIMETIKTITCTAIIGYVAWTISQSASQP